MILLSPWGRTWPASISLDPNDKQGNGHDFWMNAAAVFLKCFMKSIEANEHRDSIDEWPAQLKHVRREDSPRFWLCPSDPISLIKFAFFSKKRKAKKSQGRKRRKPSSGLYGVLEVSECT